MVLRESFKPNAIYYIGDTFSAGLSSETRATYGLLFALIIWADRKVLDLMIRAAWFNAEIPDHLVDPKAGLLEAHIFEQISFNGGVTRMVLNVSDVILAHGNWAMGGKKGPEPASQQVAVANAELFCRQNGIKLEVTGGW
jgi:hypothetical protein